MTATTLTRMQARIGSLGSDTRQLLLLLIAVACILLPHLSHLPVWCSAVALAAFFAKVTLVVMRRGSPPSWLLAVGTAVICAATWREFGTLLGRDAGVALLAMLIGAKLLELHARRDSVIVICLGFFLAICQFLYSQEILVALTVLVATIVLLATMVNRQLEGDPAVDPPPSFRRAFAMAAMLASLSVPLVAALFILFPRLPGPLWGTPQAGSSGTGMSDTMSPGSVSSLAQSDAIAFRARFETAAPPNNQLYWRALVLDDYDGRTWRERRRFGIDGPETAVDQSNAKTAYTVTQEPLGRPWLYLLERPADRPSFVEGDRGIQMTGPLTFSSERAMHERIRYRATAAVQVRYHPDESPAALKDMLRLPQGFDPRTHQLGEQLRAEQHGDSGAIVAAALRMYRNSFSYTLEPPALGANAVDDFLFSTRAGFCEHFASSFVVLMRAAGVPARVVTGYQGGELNPVDGWYEVRQRDAHAWAEVWKGDGGWVRIDPTAAVSPDRVDLGLRSAIPQAASLGGFVLGPSSPLTAAAEWLRNRWDAVENNWNQWVIQYDTDSQRSLLDWLGLKHFEWHDLVIALIVIVTGTSLLMTAVVLWRHEPRDPLLKRFGRFEAKLARAGMARQRHEGPVDWFARIAKQLSSSKSSEARRIVDRFVVLRYRSVEQHSPADLAELSRWIRSFKVG